MSVDTIRIPGAKRCPECGCKTFDKVNGLCWWKDCRYHTAEAWAILDAECRARGEPLMYPDAPSRLTPSPQETEPRG